MPYGGRKPVVRTISIASGQTTSAEEDIQDYMVAGLITPSALTSTTITFQASNASGGTFVDVYDSDGNQVSLAVAASRAIGLSGAEADALAPFKWIKVVCGSAEGAARTIQLILK
jgi:hypothetical protein